ncbi:hypothetical protein KKF82_07565 [Patescibacteria group bacterium]|nr:hypothetical protein [Patescibacteria group bacterium]
MIEAKKLYDELITISLGVPTVIGMFIPDMKLFFPMFALSSFYFLIVRKALGWDIYYMECE